MRIYIGIYRAAGRGFEAGNTRLMEASLELCESLPGKSYLENLGNGNMCFTAAAGGDYGKWEGHILDKENQLRLDLQENPASFDSARVVWVMLIDTAGPGVPTPVAEPLNAAAQAPHWAQWQIQQGKNSLAGVIMAQRRVIPLRAFQDAMRLSFAESAFGVVTSDEIREPAERDAAADLLTCPRAEYSCDSRRCAGKNGGVPVRYTAFFINSKIKQKYVRVTGRGARASASPACPRCKEPLELVRDMDITEPPGSLPFPVED